MSHEIEANQFVVEEVWRKYGHHPSFKGWYLSMEISRKTKGAIAAFSTLGQLCKDMSGGLQTLISPWIDGPKAVAAASAVLKKDEGVSLLQHEQEWDEIFAGIHQHVDVVAFQDGHVEFHELADYLSVNKALADKHGLRCWTNAESFDRDYDEYLYTFRLDYLLDGGAPHSTLVLFLWLNFDLCLSDFKRNKEMEPGRSCGNCRGNRLCVVGDQFAANHHP